MTRQAGKEAVYKLVEDFEKNERQYMSKSFQEAEARSRFIDPFFTALGWELNQTNITKKFWDVHREFSQRDNSTTKKPDYAFRIKEGTKYREKFFVEAKAPHVDLNGNIPVFQAKRYAFSSHGKTPIVILTDFQTFRVFNGLERPIFENPLQGLIKGHDLEYHTYLDTWDKIWEDFSKEAVTEGSIERIIGKAGRNAKSLDDEFLADISAWRETLARNVAIRNKDLSVDHINEAVQRILDRLIFIRNLEDREIESEDGLLSMLDVKENIYPRIIPMFRNLDGEYNGLLFKEHFSEKIIVDDPIIKSLIKQLYPPNSPYAFDMIEPEILGRIYERFLGSKIRLTENHQAKVEEKPEVRHAGGVYYTPQYIVDYIVENTVGVKIKDKSPEEIAAIKICDPACGSGSFLLGAFQYLIEYHREWYAKANSATQKKYKDDFFTNAESEVQLTLKKKTEILKNNIFGVDIDREATEVAIMSLYLKILDDGYDKGQGELFLRGHILPDMAGNIKCGNSLIGTDFYIQGDLDLNENDVNKVNCFDWDGKDGFAEIFKNGGFDVVIGNPPYGADFSKQERTYLHNNFAIPNYQYDSYLFFIEKNVKILKQEGNLGLIIPNTWLLNLTAGELRKYLFSNVQIEKIVHYLNKVFKDAVVDTEVIIFKNSTSHHNDIEINIFNKDGSIFSHKISQKKLIDLDGLPVNIFEQKEYQSIKEKADIFPKLDVVCKITQGTKPFQVGKGKPPQTKKVVENKPYVSDNKKDDTFVPLLRGSMMNRYQIFWNNDYWIKFGDWLAEPRYSASYDKEKIIIRQTGDSLIATYDKDKFIVRDNLYTIVNNPDSNISLKYILGIINSRFLNWYYQKLINNEKGEALAQVKRGHLAILPIPSLDLSQKANKTKQDNLVSLVDKMLDLKKKEAAEVSDHQKTIITRKIDAVDKAIDTAVYELYNLTEDEIKVVEGRE